MEIKFIDLKQRHLEAFIKEMPIGDNVKETPIILYTGIVVRAACKAGWYLEPIFKVEDVDEMLPAQARELFNATMKVYSEAMGIPPS